MRQYPPGFLALCWSIACERFSFFSLLALLLLYLNEHRGFSIADSTDLIGFFVAGSYLTPLIGGGIADRRLGYFRTASMGCLLGGTGYAVLMCEGTLTLNATLTLVAIGSGMFKSSTQAVAGRLYTQNPKDRDSGFTLLYLLVNVGGVFGPVLGEAARDWFGWQAAFTLAALGMVAAWGFLHSQERCLRAADSQRALKPKVPATSASTPWWTLLKLCLLSLLFTVAHMQTSSTLLLWARDHADRQILGWKVPVPYIAALPAALVLGLSPLLSCGLSLLRRAHLSVDASRKIAVGMAVSGLAYLPMAIAAHIGKEHPTVSLGWLLICLSLLSLGELLVAALGPSLMLRLAPPHHSAGWLGAWYSATAGGYWLAGRLGVLWTEIPHSYFFLLIAVLPIAGVSLVSRYPNNQPGP